MKTLKQILQNPIKKRKRREINYLIQNESAQELKHQIKGNETVENVILGFHNERLSLLAATDQRLLFISKGMFYKKIREIEYDEISAATLIPKMFTSSVALQINDEVFTMSKVSKSHAKQFAKFVDGKSENLMFAFAK